MLYHVEQSVPGGDPDIFALVGAVFADANTSRSVEPARGGQLWRSEVIVPEKLQVSDAAPLSLTLAYLEAQVNARAHFDRRPASLAVTLREMNVAGGDQAALGIHRHQHGGARRKLLDINVTGRLTWRNGAQPLMSYRLVSRHGIRRVRWQNEPLPLSQLRLSLRGTLT